jgi:hypothetical protein
VENRVSGAARSERLRSCSAPLLRRFWIAVADGGWWPQQGRLTNSPPTVVPPSPPIRKRQGTGALQERKRAASANRDAHANVER